MTHDPDAASSASEAPSLVECRRQLARVRRQLEQEQQWVAELRRQQQQLQHSIQKISDTHEEHRYHFSRTLHDEAGQVLAALKLSLEMALEDLAQLEPAGSRQQAQLASIREELQQAKGFGEDTAGHIQAVMQQLYPSALNDLGLNLALEGLCQDFADIKGLAVSYRYVGVARPDIPRQIKIALYRILEKLLADAARQVNGNRIKVGLQVDPSLITLRVEEVGRREPFSGELLSYLRTRLLGSGGRLEREETSGRANTLAVRVPREQR